MLLAVGFGRDISCKGSKSTEGTEAHLAMRCLNLFDRAGRIVVLSISALVFTAGCIAVGGTDNFTQPTLGRQLQDLKVARDTGAISDDEYKDCKGRLIAGQYSTRK